MSARIHFIGNEKITVTAEASEVAHMLGEAGVVELELAQSSGGRTAYINPANILYVEGAPSNKAHMA